MKTKNIYLSLFFFALIAIKSSAQAPQAIPYQAVARDSSGNPIANQLISLRFSLHDSTATGPILYQETHSVTTNLLGLLYADIGRGTPVIGTFSLVTMWGYDPIWLQVEMDFVPHGGDGYLNMGTQQLLSVPYAFYSNVSGTAADSIWTVSGSDIYNSNTGKVGVGTSAPGSKLSVKGNMSIGDSVADKTSPPNGLNVQGGIMVGFTDDYEVIDGRLWIDISNNGKLGKYIGGLKYEDIADSTIKNTGLLITIGAADSVTGSKMNLIGGSDSAVIIGNSIIGSGSGKEFIGNVTLTRSIADPDYPWLPKAVGSDTRLTASDSVIGSDMNLTGGSDSASVYGDRMVVSGSGKEFIGSSRLMEEEGIYYYFAVGSEIRLSASDSVTGSNMHLTGGSDSAVVIGNRIVASGSGKEFIGTWTDDYRDQVTFDVWGRAIGSEIRLTASDSVTGSNSVLKGGSDSAVVIGHRTIVRGSGKELIGWTISYPSTPDPDNTGWTRANGIDMNIGASDSVTGSNMHLTGGSDSAVVIGDRTIVSGSGKKFIGASRLMEEEGIYYYFSMAVGSEERLTASDSVIGNDMNLRGGSDSAVMIGTNITGSGSGKEFIGNRTTLERHFDANGEYLLYSAKGSDTRLVASDSVTGSDMDLRGGSDSAVVIGNRTVVSGSGKEFIGTWSDMRDQVTFDVWGIAIGSKIRLTASDSVTGSNMNLIGTSDSAIVIGNSIIGSGAGGKFIGNTVKNEPWTPVGPVIWANVGIGSDINITATDSATGVNIVVDKGSDSTKINGLTIKLGPNAAGSEPFYADKKWCFRVVAIDEAKNTSIGTDLILGSHSSLTGHKLTLAGTSDSSNVTGMSVSPQGNGIKFRGFSTSFIPETDDEVLVYFPTFKFATGSELKVTGVDSVIGSDIVLKAGSDTTKMIGLRIKAGPNAANAVGSRTWCFGLKVDDDATGHQYTTGVKLALSATDSVTGSNSVLKGGSDSAVVIGHSTLVSGSGKEFLGNLTKMEIYDYPGEYYQKAIGSDIRLIARDSVVGSRIIIGSGTDSTKVVGISISNQGQDGSTAQWPMLNRILVTDNAWKSAIGSDLMATAPLSVTGNRLQLSGASDSSKINGIVILPEGTGSVLTGSYLSNYDYGDTQTHEVGHWMGRKAVGSDIRLTARDAVTGNNIIVRGSSDSTRVIGTDLRVSGGRQNIGIRVVVGDSITEAELLDPTDGAYCMIALGGNVGIGTSSPKTTLDINGSLAIREIEIPVLNTQNNNVAWVENGEGGVVMTEANFPFTLSGLTGGSDGRILTIYNHTGQPWNLQNENSSSSPSNRILTLIGSDLQSEGNSVATLQYSLSDQRWVVVSHNNFIDGSLQVAIDAEATARVAADSILLAIIRADDIDDSQTFQAAIDAEVAARIAGDSIMLAKHSEDVQLLTIADSTLQSNIDAEASARTAADVSLQGALNAETQARIIADNGPAGGDLSGNYPNPAVARIQGIAVSNAAPADRQVLKYNWGSSQWEPGNPTVQVSYQAGVQAPLPVTQNVVTTVIFGTASFNDGLSYNPATGIFTVPATGKYHFDAGVQWQNQTFANGRFEMQLKVNNATTKNSYTVFNQDFAQALSIDLALNAGDQVKVTVLQNAAGPINLVGGLTASTFSGHQLY